MVQIGRRTGPDQEQGSTKRPIRVRSPDFTPLRGRRDWPSRQSTGRGGDRRIGDSPSEESIPSVSARAPTRTTRPSRTHPSHKKSKQGQMRKITTAITAAALAFSMMAAAMPAAAVTGYDSAYAGESAFVNITGGQTQNFQVFFANVGTTSWQKGGATEVDLAACLEDKVTCNAQDASEATWNPSTGGWLSPTRYATTTQTVTPPGSLGTFSYNITAPTGVAAGIYHFNGDLVLSSTGERIHPEGYFQDANTGVSAGAATLTLINPNSGSSNGGDTVTITGSGIVCNPTFPTVSLGNRNGHGARGVRDRAHRDHPRARHGLRDRYGYQ